MIISYEDAVSGDSVYGASLCHLPGGSAYVLFEASPTVKVEIFQHPRGQARSSTQGWESPVDDKIVLFMSSRGYRRCKTGEGVPSRDLQRQQTLLQELGRLHRFEVGKHLN